MIYIQPGKPQQNAYVERYKRTVRTEWLGRYHCNSIEEVQDHATHWLRTYNERPNMGVGPSQQDQVRAMLKEGQSLRAIDRIKRTTDLS